MNYLAAQLDTVKSAMLMRVTGKVQAISGLTIEASDLPLKTQVTTYPLAQANAALDDLRHGRFTGAAVLVP